MNEKSDPQLEFSDKYTAEHARQYFSKHQQGFWRKLSNRRELAIARKALKIAGDPVSVLDLPSGTGRFWELLAEKPDRQILAADYSENMLQVAMQMRPENITRRIEAFQCSAFDIPRPENAVENIFCMRLLHHIGKADDRLALFREFRRVAAKSICISLWVDGNYQARRRHRLESRRAPGKYQNRFVLPASQVETEFGQAGLGIIDCVDFLKFHSMWRIYILGTT
ncbi:MAG: class I SAM-dependent methyltransferase [Gammaproteobacteria bacterium]|nr:class I SAM-dependent methyltransferase [Gammaproteobacteria bacterium]